jgi:Na+-translocating ferredoxin:NAD+ oxidoreductase RNF subunit RnfB
MAATAAQSPYQDTCSAGGSGVSQPLREILGGEASATFKGLELENMENQDYLKEHKRT